MGMDRTAEREAEMVAKVKVIEIENPTAGTWFEVAFGDAAEWFATCETRSEADAIAKDLSGGEAIGYQHFKDGREVTR